MADSDFLLIEFESAFELFSKDGMINKEGLKNILKALEESPPSEEEITTLIEVVDSDGDGWITFDEFMKIMKIKFEQMEKSDKIKEAFQLCDTNGDGIISTGVVRHALKNLGDSVPEEEVNRLLQQFEDTQTINYEELIKEYEIDVAEYLQATNQSNS